MYFFTFLLSVTACYSLDNLGPIFPKSLFPLQNIKNKYRHQIPNISINLWTKFHFKQTILDFWNKSV